MFWRCKFHLRAAQYTHQQFPTYRHEAHASASLRLALYSTQQSISASVADASTANKETPRLPPVPPLRKVLFDGTIAAAQSESLWSLAQQLRRPHDVNKVLRVLEEAEVGVSNAYTLTAVIARVRALGAKPPATLLNLAMATATNNPTLMKNLLDVDEESQTSESDRPNSKTRRSRVDLFKYVCRKIPTHLASRSQEATRKTKLQWLRLFTGWPDDSINTTHTFPNPHLEREHCIVSLIPQFDEGCWQSYMHLLSKLGTGEVIEREWKMLQSETSLPTEEGNPPNKISKDAALNITIQSLIDAGDPTRAWKLAYESHIGIQDLHRQTLCVLLAHPDGLKAWHPHFNDLALEMLASEITKVEEFLGVQWEGDEDGFHRPYTMAPPPGPEQREHWSRRGKRRNKKRLEWIRKRDAREMKEALGIGGNGSH